MTSLTFNCELEWIRMQILFRNIDLSLYPILYEICTADISIPCISYYFFISGSNFCRYEASLEGWAPLFSFEKKDLYLSPRKIQESWQKSEIC